MLQELALAAAAWSAAALDNAWFAIHLQLVVEERIADRPPAIDGEPIAVDEIAPGQRISIRISDDGAPARFLTGRVEEVGDEQIVLSQTITQEVQLQFRPASWAAPFPYLREHWGGFFVRETLVYQGGSVIPFSEARRVEAARFPDWNTAGSLPYQVVSKIFNRPTWYLDTESLTAGTR